MIEEYEFGSEPESEVIRRALLARKLADAQAKDDLPHLNGLPWYPWAWEFFNSTNKSNLLCAANQVSKSSTQIRKCIHWATAMDLWGKLWASRPNQFWYMYPSRPVLEAEFETKWKQFLPSGDMKNHEVYGWKEIKSKQELVGIRFNSGVIVYFKLYSQKLIDLQAGSVYAMFCDEEMPIALYGELRARLNATKGYFHMVFTATLGQDFWRRALEPGANEKEELVGAWKRQVSLYDSMYYMDGSPSQWTEEYISEVKSQCKTHQDFLKRVMGKFIMVGNRKYHAFDATKHMKKKHPLPKDWIIYGAADPGSGGDEGHPAALCYIAVKPNYREARVFSGWRGDGVQTDSSAIVKKHKEIKLEEGFSCVTQFYDWSSKDFFIVSQGMGENFVPADKSHDRGEEVINTLFENNMCFIYETEELNKLCSELSSLKKDENKRHAKDDFADAFRYCVTKIPWDFSGITKLMPSVEKVEEKLSDVQQQCKDRREQMSEKEDESWPDPQEEFDEWNEIAGSD